MPTYEYSCNDCGEQLEVVQSIHDDSLTVCPNCGGPLRKHFGNVGVVFKGSGFYKTDSRDRKSAAKKSAAPAKTSTDSTSSSSGDGSASSSPSTSGGESKPSSTGSSSTASTSSGGDSKK